MKNCPKCGVVYPDDTLRFCLEDGTPLLGESVSDSPTLVLNEQETVVARSGAARISVPIGPGNSAQWQNSQVTRVATAIPPGSGSNSLLVGVIIALVLVIIFGVLGVGGYWLLNRNADVTARNTTGTPNPLNSNGLPSPAASPSATRTPSTAVNANNVAAPPSAVDDQQVRSAVSQRLNSWKSQAEALDLNSYMSHYAPTVDYYNKNGSSLSAVRTDKMKAFSRYGSIRVNLSNMSVTTDPSGQTATAVFDKEWDFQGNGSSSGKVKQMMRFRKIDGQWLITAEKDLQLYYKR